MIETCTGSQIASLMDRVESHTPRYREMIICTPYIDRFMATRIHALRTSGNRHRCGVRVITSPVSVDDMRATNGGSGRRGDLIVRPGLHAKIYLAIGRDAGATEAIVSSANLTRAGMSRNIEFGVKVDGSTPAGRALLQQIQWFLTKIAA